MPKLDFSKGIPAECTTLVAVPSLLLNEKQVRELVNDLEVRFLANREPNLHFALLTDLPDSVSKPRENDSHPLVELAVRLINDLNARYVLRATARLRVMARFSSCTAIASYNTRQGVWMGWERKRGKLLDLNKLLAGTFDAFPIKAGRLEVLRTVRYILTLDSDTQLPHGAAAQAGGRHCPPAQPGGDRSAAPHRHRRLRNPAAARERCGAARPRNRGWPPSIPARMASIFTRAPSPTPTRICSAKASLPGREFTKRPRCMPCSIAAFRAMPCSVTT